jgi:predicted DsbA family dithiol-disulfide isomerase
MAPKEVKKHTKNSSFLQMHQADDIKIIFYTDPLCCWTWAMWPKWEEWKSARGASLSVDYKMGGLLPSWANYHDDLNSISRPVHMAAEWAHAGEVGQVEINDRVLLTDPPASSYPACIAVKAVAIQSTTTAEGYFHLLQKGLMIHGRNITRVEELIKTAELLKVDFPGFDPLLFREDLLGSRGRLAFSSDLQEVKYLNIIRFPCLIVHRPRRRSVVLAGYQTIDALNSIDSDN